MATKPDPRRIDQVLRAVRAAWLEQPDLRLMQLLYGAIDELRPLQPSADIFYLEDAQLIDALGAFRQEHAQRPLVDHARATEMTAVGWDYRVFVSAFLGEPEFSIRETWFDRAGYPTGWTGDCAPYGTTLEELRRDLGHLMEALDKPVIEDPSSRGRRR